MSKKNKIVEECTLYFDELSKISNKNLAAKYYRHIGLPALTKPRHWYYKCIYYWNFNNNLKKKYQFKLCQGFPKLVILHNKEWYKFLLY